MPAHTPFNPNPNTHCSTHPHVYTLCLLVVLDGPGHTVEALGHGLPLAGHLHHAPGVQYAVAKQVVELQAHAVPAPLVDLVVQLVPLGREHRQVLHVPPCQVRTVGGRGETDGGWETDGGGVRVEREGGDGGSGQSDALRMYCCLLVFWSRTSSRKLLGSIPNGKGLLVGILDYVSLTPV